MWKLFCIFVVSMLKRGTLAGKHVRKVVPAKNQDNKILKERI